MQRNRHRLPGLLAAFVLFTGPGPMVPGALAVESSDTDATSRGTDLETLKADWAGAMESLKGYSAAQRDEALKAARTQLDAMDAQIEKLEDEAAEQWQDLSASARERREATLRTLRARRQELAEWYGGMKHSSQSAWDDVKQGFIKAYDALGKSFDDAVEQFEKK